MSTHTEQNKSGLELRPLLALLAVGLAYFFCSFHRFSLGVISADLTRDFSLDPKSLGLIGSAFFYSYGFMQVPSGLLSDKLGSRVLIAVSCLFTAAATLWFSTTTGFLGLFSSRTLTGFAVAFVYVPALAVVREWFDEKVFSTMTGVLVAMGQLGTISSSIPLQLTIDRMGWRGTFRIIAYISVALCLLVWFIVRRKSGPQQEKKQDEGILKSSIEAFKTPGFWAIAFFFFIFSGVQFSFQGLWGARFFESALGRGEEKAALLLAISLGCFVGAMMLGVLADRFGRFRVLACIGFAMVLLQLLMLFLGFSSGGITLYLLCFAFGVLATGSYSVAFSVVRYFSSQSNGGFLTGINGCCGFVGGAVFTQLLGIFFNFSGIDSAAGFRIIFMVFAGICLLATILMIRLNINRFKKQA